MDREEEREERKQDFKYKMAVLSKEIDEYGPSPMAKSFYSYNLETNERKTFRIGLMLLWACCFWPKFERIYHVFYNRKILVKGRAVLSCLICEHIEMVALF